MSLLEKAQQFFAAHNKQDLDTVVSMIDPKANIHTPMGSFVGGEAYREWVLMYFRAMPNFAYEIRGLALELDQMLAFELHTTGTMTGRLVLSNGIVPPTGRAINVSGASFWRFENELIVEYHLYLDRLVFFSQLGLPPIG